MAESPQAEKLRNISTVTDGLMSFKPRARTPRDLGKRPAKSKQKAKLEKHRDVGTRGLPLEATLNAREVVDRTVNRLHHLGGQRFAVPPFHEHLDRWLLNLRDVIAYFESSGAFNVDDQFRKESSEAVSQIERELDEHRLMETTHAEKVRKINQDLLKMRSLLAQTEREKADKIKEMIRQEESAVKPVAGRMDRLRTELNQISLIRAGFFRSISKKAKAKRQEEAAQKLESTRKQLKQVERSFAVEEKRLNADHENKRTQLLKQIDEYARKLEILEAESDMDDAVEIRQAACESLVKAVNMFLERNPLPPIGEGDGE